MLLIFALVLMTHAAVTGWGFWLIEQYKRMAWQRYATNLEDTMREFIDGVKALKDRD